MAKQPPKGTINQNIMMFLQKKEQASLEDLSSYLGYTEPITEQIMSNLISKGYVSKITNTDYVPNYLYPNK